MKRVNWEKRAQDASDALAVSYRLNIAQRDLLNQLADCYFLHRGEGILDLMMRANRFLEESDKTIKRLTK